MRVMIATVMQSLPVTLLVEGGIFVTVAVGLRLRLRRNELGRSESRRRKGTSET